MLEIGSQLYNLTDRDRQTIFLEPFLRRTTVTLAAAGTTAQCDFSLPIDRCLYLHSVVFDLAAEAATNWESWSVNIRRPGLELAGILYQEAITPVLNTRVSRTLSIGFVCPPGVNLIRFGASRVTTTNAVNASAELVGYLMPAGEIGRA